MSDRESGIVTWFSDQKGYGFIQREGAADVFVHQSKLDGEGRRTLVVGQRVEFAVEAGAKGPNAVRVEGSVQGAGPAPEREPGRPEWDEGLVARTVHVGNLSYEIGDAELRGLFEQAGEVEKVTRFTDRKGEPRRCGFVQMKDKGGAQRAIEELDGVKVKNRSMLVAKAKPPSTRRRSSGPGTYAVV